MKVYQIVRMYETEYQRPFDYDYEYEQETSFTVAKNKMKQEVKDSVPERLVQMKLVCLVVDRRRRVVERIVRFVWHRDTGFFRPKKRERK